MLFNRKKFVVINVMDNTCVAYVSPTNVGEDVSIRRASKFTEKEAKRLVARLQANLEFVKYKMYEAWC